MNPLAVTKARSRLRTAQKTVSDLAECKKFSQFLDLWYPFLTSANSIYTALQQGAKSSPASIQWFEKKNTERRKDPLLRYIYEARNDDEHGVNPVAMRDPGFVAVGGPASGFSSHLEWNTVEGGGLKVESRDGQPVLIEYEPPQARLVRVRDRHGRPHDPPGEHLGQKLASNHPQVVARLAVVYLSALVEEAAGLANAE